MTNVVPASCGDAAILRPIVLHCFLFGDVWPSGGFSEDIVRVARGRSGGRASEFSALDNWKVG
jgi:hypothetical protein